MGRGKRKRKLKQKRKRLEKTKKGKIVRFDLANSPRKYKGFCNRHCFKTNIHNLIYKDAFFSNVRFHASNITRCNFRNAKLLGVDFVGCNLKKTNFKGAKLNNVVFLNCNLKETNFEGALLENVIFIMTNIEVARNIQMNSTCKDYRVYTKVDIDDNLLSGLNRILHTEQYNRYHVLHTSKNEINHWIVNVLVDRYGSKLSRGLQALYNRKNKRRFYTLYSYINFFDSYFKV